MLAKACLVAAATDLRSATVRRLGSVGSSQSGSVLRLLVYKSFGLFVPSLTAGHLLTFIRSHLLPPAPPGYPVAKILRIGLLSLTLALLAAIFVCALAPSLS